MAEDSKELSRSRTRSSQVAEPMPVAQLRRDAPPFLVVEKQSVSSRRDNQNIKLFALIPLIVMIAFVSFTAGSYFASERVLRQVKPFLREDASVDIDYGWGVFSPGITDQRVSPQDIVERKTQRPGSSRTPSYESKSNDSQDTLESSATLRGEVRPQKPEQLGPQRSGWGDAFELVSISAEEAGMKDDKLLYLWKLSIKNRHKREVVVEIHASLTDKANSKIIAKQTRRTTLLPLEVIELEGDFLVDLEQKNDIGDIQATVRTPY